MKKTEKLQSISKKISALLLVCSLIIGGTALAYTILFIKGTVPVIAFISPEYNYSTSFLFLAVFYIFAGIFFYSSRIFKHLGNSDTPFVQTLPEKIKRIAALSFVFIAVPNSIFQMLRNMDGSQTGNGLVFFSSANIFALVLALIIYCIALVFEYGCVIQEENFEIL